MFVSHHLEEIEASFWEKHLKTTEPESLQVLDILVLLSHWAGEETLTLIPLILPCQKMSQITFLSVSFDEEGKVEEITMESQFLNYKPQLSCMGCLPKRGIHLAPPNTIYCALARLFDSTSCAVVD